MSNSIRHSFSPRISTAGRLAGSRHYFWRTWRFCAVCQPAVGVALDSLTMWRSSTTSAAFSSGSRGRPGGGSALCSPSCVASATGRANSSARSAGARPRSRASRRSSSRPISSRNRLRRHPVISVQPGGADAFSEYLGAASRYRKNEKPPEFGRSIQKAHR
jgi:hypothetical protein